MTARDYPVQYVQAWQMKDGGQVLIRPIRPEDEPMMILFHESLTDRSVYLRYFHMISLSRRVAHDRLARICFVDYDREIALVAERKDPQSGSHEIIAVGRLVKLPSGNDAEVAVLVSDAFQHRGLGTELVRRLVEIARLESCHRVIADLLLENTVMQRVFRKLGFELQYSIQDGMKAVLALDSSTSTECETPSRA
jgi:acetyltransferase